MVGHYPGMSSYEDVLKAKAGLLPPVWSKEHNLAVWDTAGNHGSKPITLDQINTFTDKTRELCLEVFNFSHGMTVTDG